MKKIFFSIIIPTKNITSSLMLENLPALEKQTFKNFEVILLPNKTDKKPYLIKKYPWLKIIPTKRITRPSKKRNLGAKYAKGQIIAFIDDDAYPEKNWLKNAAKFFIEKEAVAVCGPGILPKKTNFWEKLFDEILKSFLGSGSYNYRFLPKKEMFVDDAPSMNFFIKKNIFDSLGGFNGNYWPGEDSKLCEDLVYKKGKKIIYSPKLLVYHHRRNGLCNFLRQHGAYGFHRGAFFAQGDQNSKKLFYFIPTFFVFYLLFLLFSKLYHLINLTSLISLPLLLYISWGILLSLKSLINTKNIFIFLAFFPILFLNHLIYGIMFFAGILAGKKYER